jgi:hypothetical protein
MRWATSLPTAQRRDYQRFGLLGVALASLEHVGRIVPTGQDHHHVQIWKQGDPLTAPTGCLDRIQRVSVSELDAFAR